MMRMVRDAMQFANGKDTLKSKGAKAELAAAKAVGLEVIFEAYGTPI